MMKSSSVSSPILSILVPAYNDPSGVLRIISPILNERRPDIEVLVHDDSSDNHVEQAVRVLMPANSSLHYLHNRPSLGAVDNWNSLLKAARGRYVALIHHDDFPLSEQFASEVIDELRAKDWPDALIMSCLVHDVARNQIRMGTHAWINQIIIPRWPAYLLRRNLIGPPSVMVVRRDAFTAYDNQLKWLVDVDAYYRFLIKKRWRVEFSHLLMVSSTGAPGAITTSIQSEKNKIRDAELIYIIDKYSRKNIWNNVRERLVFMRVILHAEWILWLGIKALNITFNGVASRHVSISAILHRRMLV